ncbi:lipopolysaccharide heptosyltransferase II [Persephonella atlantica]|uniref:lipopolysaccharide heptosyltransferase II n=1 Tax=Persephonella atlantica TaxID=2699429 RepID=A0ABS1GJD7_9AQUI|nr:lipopolysaccharide heptosyltransferase II [Persephonella atlantica]MBK3332996.1 lipopolysaccharide heptosyltransferase II [Persephonella atlantica]
MKILVWQTAFLGDLILTTPLFHSIKSMFPGSELTVITKPFGRDVLKNNPYVDRLIIFDKKESSTWNLIKRLKKEQYDVAISPHRSHRASYSLFLSRIPFRAGFDRAGFSFLYTKTVSHRFDGTHEIDRNLSLLTVFPQYDEKKIYRFPELFLSNSEDRFYTQHELKDKNYTVIAPGSKWATKRWTAEGFAVLIDFLAVKGEKIVIIGGKEDAEYVSKILSLSRNTDKVLNLTGKTSLRESFSIIKHAKALISNDSAPVHMAVAFNTPVIDIYGPTVTDFGFYPYRNGAVVEVQLKCRPCGLHGHNQCPIKTHECMKKINPEMVVEAYNKLTKQKTEEKR